MELRHLRYFVAAAEEQHMTRASERLRISQPALSEQIRELESDLGLRLFERVARGIRLSPAGREFLERARNILADVEVARERAFHAERGEVGRLRLAFNEIAGQQRAVGQAVQRFRNAYPAIELDITQMAGHEQVEALRLERIDAGFHHGLGRNPDGCEFLKLRKDNLILAVPALHPLAKRARLRIEDLRNVPQIWMHRSFNPALYDRLQALFLAKGLTPRVIQEVRGDIAILNLVSVGLGVGVVVSARRLGESESVVFKRVAGLSLPLDFGLAWRRGDGSRVLRNFTALLKAA